ncbi:MAG: S-layer homology domain-containing protein [Clostridia bacterium]
MTNLKKVIALTLASSLALSSVASAAFTDADDIDNADAVATLSALGVINGYTDGTFRPNDTVTRGEMAKMIFTIKNGGSDDASAFEGIYSEFTDVEGHWASGYIKFCENTGIIAGYTDGTFLPDEEVTGVEALKMALVALGYSAEKAGLEGTYWSQNTISKAVLAGLTDDVTDFASDATRENAAQILYNALYADMVKWDVDSEDFVDKYTLYTTTLAEDAMDLIEYDGVVTEIIEDGFKLAIYDDDDSEFTGATKSFEAFEDYTTDLGSFVTVLANSDNEVFGLNVDEDTVAYIEYQDNLDEDGEDAWDTLEIEDDNGYVFDDFDAEGWAKLYGGTYTNADGDEVTLAGAFDNSIVIITDNDVDDYHRVYVLTSNVGEVTYVSEDDYIRVQFFAEDDANSDSKLYTGSETFDFDDDVIPSGLDADDDCYVSVTYSSFLACAVVEELVHETGTVDAVKDGTYSIDGTYYNPLDGSSFSYGDEVEFVYVDDILYWADNYSSDVDVEDYIMLTQVAKTVTIDDGTSVDSSVNYWSALAMDYNGNEFTIKIAGSTSDDAEDYGTGTDANTVGSTDDFSGSDYSVTSNYVAPTLGLYSYETDDGYYLLTDLNVEDFEFSDISALDCEATPYDEDDEELNGYPVSDDAVFYVAIIDGDYDVYGTDLDFEMVTGAELKTWDEEDFKTYYYEFYLDDEDDFETVVLGYIIIDDDSLPGASSKLYGFVTSSYYEVQIDGEEYVTFKVFNGEEEIRYYAEGDLNDYGISSGVVICYSIDSTDGDYIFVDVEEFYEEDDYTYGVYAVQAYTSSYVRFYIDPEDADAGYTSRYTIEDDTFVIYVDTDDDDGIVGGSMSKAYALYNDGEYEPNVFAVLDNDEMEIVAIFFDVNLEYRDTITDIATVN